MHGYDPKFILVNWSLSIEFQWALDQVLLEEISLNRILVEVVHEAY